MDDKYKPIVYTISGSAAALGVPGVFVPDAGILAGQWGAMLFAIAAESDHELDKAFCLKVASGVIAGAGALVTGVKTFAWAIKWLPGLGTGTAMVINSGLNYTYTYRLGKAFAEMLERPNYSVHDAGTTTLALLGMMMVKFPTPA